MHVESFLTHVENGAYVGIEFHRVISGFMIQGGDVESMGGSGGYAAHYYGWCNGKQMPESQCPDKTDYTIPHEHDNGLKHTVGALAAAHAGVNTDGSQFYIIPSDGSASHLDADEPVTDLQTGEKYEKDCTGQETPDFSKDDGSCHTVFGYVTEGQNHVDAISKVETNSNRPVDPVRILSASVIN